MKNKHPYVTWAEKTIETFIKENKKIEPEEELNNELFLIKRGCFVSIHGENDSLRGCIGTIEPVEINLAYEIRNNALSAAFHDPRFPPIRDHEISFLNITVDVLSKPEIINSYTELNPKKYGVIISKGYRKGLLLPNLPGVDSVEKQIQIAKNKAGLFECDDVDIYRFLSERYY